MSFVTEPLSKDPIVTAKKFLQYKRANGHFSDFDAPKVILICYQQSTLKYFLNKYPDLTENENFSDLFLTCDGQVGILGGWGIGAPALSIKLEQLAALGAVKFIAVGTAGTLLDSHKIGDMVICSSAIAEDGVAHLYLGKENSFARVSPSLAEEWASFANKKLPSFQNACSWSFSAIFKETAYDVARVYQKGCRVVEMEAATLYAIATKKKLEALTLFVISDCLTLEEWIPHIREPIVRENLHKLADTALAFCYNLAAVSLD